MPGPPLLCWDDSRAAASAIRSVATILQEPRRGVVAFAYLPRAAGGDGFSRGPTAATPRLTAAEADAVLDRGVHAARAAGIDASGLPIAATTAAPAITKAADEQDASVIVLGQRPRSQLSRFLLGSVARDVVRGTDRPVVVVGGPAEESMRSAEGRGDAAGQDGSASPDGAVVLCWDGSEGARQAMRDARAVLGPRPAIVFFAHVPTEAARGILGGASGPDAPIMGEADAEILVEEGVHAAQKEGFAATPMRVVADRKTADLIAAVADEQDAPLVAMGQRKRSALGTLVLGSVTRGVLATHHRPVLLSGPESAGVYPG